MPLLRRTYDHHRAFRARMSAKTPALTSSSRNQDRHLMMPSLLCRHCHCGSFFSRRAAGFARSRARLCYCPSPAVHIGKCVPTCSAASCTRQRAAWSPRLLNSDQTARPNPHSPRHRHRTISRRDFVPWRLSVAGRISARKVSSCRRPKTCTGRDQLHCSKN